MNNQQTKTLFGFDFFRELGYEMAGGMEGTYWFRLCDKRDGACICITGEREGTIPQEDEDIHIVCYGEEGVPIMQTTVLHRGYNEMGWDILNGVRVAIKAMEALILV